MFKKTYQILNKLKPEINYTIQQPPAVQNLQHVPVPLNCSWALQKMSPMPWRVRYIIFTFLCRPIDSLYNIENHVGGSPFLGGGGKAYYEK